MHAFLLALLLILVGCVSRQKNWTWHSGPFSMNRYSTSHWTFDHPCEVLGLSIVSESSQQEPVKGIIYRRCPADFEAAWNLKQQTRN